MPSLLLTEPFVAGFPCVRVTADTGIPGLTASLNLQIDTIGQYEVLIPASTARTLNLNYTPGFYRSAVRLLDGTFRPCNRATIIFAALWMPAGLHQFSLLLLNTFNILTHPPRVNGFVGEDFFKKAGVTFQVDYTNSEVSLWR